MLFPLFKASFLVLNQSSEKYRFTDGDQVFLF